MEFVVELDCERVERRGIEVEMLRVDEPSEKTELIKSEVLEEMPLNLDLLVVFACWVVEVEVVLEWLRVWVFVSCGLVTGLVLWTARGFDIPFAVFGAVVVFMKANESKGNGGWLKKWSELIWIWSVLAKHGGEAGIAEKMVRYFNYCWMNVHDESANRRRIVIREMNLECKKPCCTSIEHRFAWLGKRMPFWRVQEEFCKIWFPLRDERNVRAKYTQGFNPFWSKSGQSK